MQVIEAYIQCTLSNETLYTNRISWLKYFPPLISNLFYGIENEASETVSMQLSSPNVFIKKLHLF